MTTTLQPEIRAVAPAALEARIAQLGENVRRHERDARDDALTCYRLFLEHQARWANRTDAPGWYTTLQTLAGLSRGTAYRLTLAGCALHSGHDQRDGRPLLLAELEDIGKMLQHGATPAEVAAVPTGTLHQAAEARANEGIVRVPVTEVGGQLLKELLEMVRPALPDVPAPEVTTLAVQFAHEHHAEFTAFIAREGGNA
ncbi:MAG TPA: hypothetical protein VHN99_00630 [Deinococcales bacterium]|nr:hypothetical protein [Deinococcales bacterium]